MTRTTLTELLDHELMTPIRLAHADSHRDASHWSGRTPAERADQNVFEMPFSMGFLPLEPFRPWCRGRAL